MIGIFVRYGIVRFKSFILANTWNKGQQPFKLVMQDDGNLVLYSGNNN
jgi:hypothetical protein